MPRSLPTMATVPAALGRRRSILAATVALVLTLAAGLTGRAKANVGLLIDIAGFTLLAVGVGLWVAPGAGLVAAGIGVLVLRDFGDQPTTGS